MKTNNRSAAFLVGICSFLLLASCHDNTATYRHNAEDSVAISGPGRPSHQTETADSLAKAGADKATSGSDTITDGTVQSGSTGSTEPQTK